jgi:DNA ligase-associated metallophosphoesterase
MDKSRLEIMPNVWLDHRRAVYLEEQAVLAVADLHLGYAWAHRFNGQMLPFGGGDQLLERLSELCAFYKPRKFVFLGDIVHQAVPVTELINEFNAIIEGLSERCETKLVIGNHDKKLRSVLRDKAVELLPFVNVGKFLLLHGNSVPDGSEEATVIMGHEHPAISLGDGIKGARFPCFMVSERVLILPAFSLWAAGSNARAHTFMSPIARGANFHQAVAICGGKLLPVKLK